MVLQFPGTMGRGVLRQDAVARPFGQAQALVLAEHTAAHRAQELETHVLQLMGRVPAGAHRGPAEQRMASEATE